MPPTITPAGQRAKNRIAEFRQNINNGATPAQARSIVRYVEDPSKQNLARMERTKATQASNFTMGTNPAFSSASGMATANTAGTMRVNLPPSVPATMLQNDTTFGDVFARRNQMEQEQLGRQQFNTDFNALTGRIGSTQLSSPFVNPEQFLNRLLLRGTTDTQMALDKQRGEQAQNIRGFAQDFAQAGTKAREQFGVADLQSNLAETRNRVAERQVQLRNTLRDFETNAERRGMSREFVESEKQAVQAEAAQELADLSIIESAQLGNLNEARAEVETLLNEKRQAFEMENMAIEAEIQRLEAMDTRESQARSEQLQIALQERTRQIETQLANEKEQREYLLQAAANGADQGTLTAITKATSPQQAAFLASPWIGRLERMQTQASIRASNASAALNEAELIAFNKAQEDSAKGILTPEQMNTANELNKQFESQPVVKAYNEGLQSYMVLEDTIANGIDGIEDMQLVYAFMKSVDPTSVVRETEFENAAKTGNMFQGAFARFNGAIKTGGFLPENVKQDFIRAARSSFEAKNNQYLNVKSEYAKRVNNTIGVNNGADYLTAYEAAAPLDPVDFDIASSLSGASAQDIQEIMLMVNQMPASTQQR